MRSKRNDPGGGIAGARRMLTTYRSQKHPEYSESTTEGKAPHIVALRKVERPNAKWLRSRVRWFAHVEGVGPEIEVRTSRLLSPRRFCDECLRQAGARFTPPNDKDWLAHLNAARAPLRDQASASAGGGHGRRG